MMPCTMQSNSNDCGIIACQTARLLAMKKSHMFNEELSSNFRSRMAYEIIKGLLLEVKR